MAADNGDIAAGAVAAAIGATPYRPARLIDRRQRCAWLLEHRGIGERNFGGHSFAFGGKAERGMVGAAADPAAPIDEGVEHPVEKLIGELEADLLRAGGGFAGELAQRVSEIAAGQAEDGHEVGRQRAALLKKVLSELATLS